VFNLRKLVVILFVCIGRWHASFSGIHNMEWTPKHTLCRGLGEEKYGSQMRFQTWYTSYFQLYTYMRYRCKWFHFTNL